MRNKKYNGIKYVAISLLVILVSVVGIAQYGKAQVTKSGVAELTEFANSLDGNINAFQAGLAYLGEEIGLNLGAVPGGGFYNPVTFHDSVVENGSFNIKLDWGQATTTGSSTYIVLGKKRYTGSDKLVCSGSGNDAFIYVNGLVPYTATYRMGTTTAVNYDYLLATTTQGIITGVEVATSTSLSASYGEVLNADDNEGDYARETFTLSTNDVVVVSLDFTTSPFSTSTMPELSTQGLTANGYAKLSCKKAK